MHTRDKREIMPGKSEERGILPGDTERLQTLVVVVVVLVAGGEWWG